MECVPTMIGFFACEAWWGKVLNVYQLEKRGYSLANRCPLCGMDEVNIEHLSMHCSMVCSLSCCFSDSFNIHCLLIKKKKGLGAVDLSSGSHGCWLGTPFFDKRFADWLEKNFGDEGRETDLVGHSSLSFG